MAIYLNGVKVAGRGISGESTYSIATREGFQGTEQEFYDYLAAVGTTSEQVDALIEQANQSIEELVNTKTSEINTLIQTEINELNDLITTKTEEINGAAAAATEAASNAEEIAVSALEDIQAARDEAIAAVPNIDNKVDKAGDTMTGFLTLSGDPTSNLHAATKQYVDNATPDLSSRVAKAGDTMTGFLTLHAAPTANMHAVTKKYVDDKTASIVTDIWYYGSSAPSNTKLLWIDSNTTTGGLKYYNGSSWAHVPVAWS